MARPESVALGGYYKTPQHITKMIACLVDNTYAHRGVEITNSNTYGGYVPKTYIRFGAYVLVDPCAGDGEAIVDLGKSLFGDDWRSTKGPECKVYTAELEESRADGCLSRLGAINYVLRQNALHGDAFHVTWGDEANADILYLNPPYDHDDEHGRLEQRFLARFTSILKPADGILIFVVPYYALAYSADHLATEYDILSCFRFPDPDFAAYKQIVLIAKRSNSPRPEPNPVVLDRVRGWAADYASMPILSDDLRPVVALSGDANPNNSLDRWRVLPLDADAAYGMSLPWQIGSDKKMTVIRGVGLDVDVPDMIGAMFPVAMPPRPAHVAVALASGLVNGREVQPDDPGSPFPPLVVKGVFLREYHTVEEKKNKDGEVTSVIMVQQPRLTVSVLDTVRWEYYDLKDGSDPSGATSVADMNVADLLTHYGASLARIMHEQCPPLFDPSQPPMEMPTFGLKPYRAQAQAIEAVLRMLFSTERPFAGENPFILGEVGTGKTLISLVVAAMLTPQHIDDTRRAMRLAGLTRKVKPVRRVLVVCPPHLLDGWRDQVNQILPGATVRILQRVSDVDAAAEPADDGDGRPGSGLAILVLSREMAKLGHAWGIGARGNTCPVCGSPLLNSPQKAADAHEWCEHTPRRPDNAWSRMAEQLAARLSFLPEVTAHGRYLSRYARKLDAAIVQSSDPEQARTAVYRARLGLGDDDLRLSFIGRLAAQIETLAAQSISNDKDALPALEALSACYMAMDAHPHRDDLLLTAVDRLYRLALDNKKIATLRRELHRLLMLAQDTSGQAQMSAILALRPLDKYESDWLTLDGELRRLRYERDGKSTSYMHAQSYIYAHNNTITVGASWNKQIVMGSPEAGRALLSLLIGQSKMRKGSRCHTPLFTAVPQPRRVALADYIKSNHPHLFDMLIIDEAHEYAHDGSAQERAAHRLAEMGKPVLVLTGTSNNGYASSLFMNMWSLSRTFREEFPRDGVGQFVNRYGYRKVKAEPKDDGRITQHIGVMSDRVETGVGMIMRKIGEAPGVMPLFILKHLLPVSVSIHKDDLDIDLPPLIESPIELEAPDDLGEKYRFMRKKLTDQIMSDLRNDRDKAGKLWGALAQLPSYLDRCHDDTGNADHDHGRRFEIRYPDSAGGGLVATADPLPADTLTPKETWVLDKVADEIANGRPVALLVWHTGSGLAERYLRLAQDRFGKKRVALLDAGRVQAVKRQAWIDRQIANGVKVLISNPRAIETGLNNLVYFSTAVWVQNPNCSSITYNQANGRFHRPGQKSDEVRVFVPYYQDTTQEIQHMLLGHKVQASRQTDGLDISSALIAAGAVSQDSTDAMAIGKAIYKMLQDGVPGKPRKAHPQLTPRPVADNLRPIDIPDTPSTGVQMRLLEKRPYYAVGD